MYVGNRAYTNFTRKNEVLFSDFVNGGITSTTTSFTPDPRIQFGIIINGTAGSFTGHHMDEIHVTANAGETFQGFLGHIEYSANNTSLATDTALLGLVAFGLSGSDATSTEDLYVMGAGKTLENKDNSTTTTVASASKINYVDVDVYNSIISGQIRSQFNTFGLIGITIGDADQKQNVFFNPCDEELVSYVSTLLPAFDHGASGASGQDYTQTNVFTMLAGVTGDLSDVNTNGTNVIYGVTFNASTGGTVGNSAFEEFSHAVIHKYTEKQNNMGGKLYELGLKKSTRAMDEIDF